MKTYVRSLIIIGVTMTLLTGACSHQDIAVIPETVEQEDWAFTAQFGEVQTKTAFQADETSIWWSPGDEISIFYGASEGSKFAATNEEEVAKAVFRGKMSAFTGETESGEMNYFWAVYPYESAVCSDGQSVVAWLSGQQSAKAGSFAPNTNISIAKSLGLALSFYNACAWFRFSVTKEGVKRVTFRGNNNEDVAGEFRISMGSDNRPTAPVVTEGRKKITLEFPNGAAFEVGKMYYITLLPQVFQKGFTVTFQTDTEAGSRSINSTATYLRSKYNTGVEFDKSIAYENNPITNGSIGEIIDSDGLGVVVWESDDKKLGLLMSVTELQHKNWTESNEWCNAYGQLWRMPTIDELTLIHNNFKLINASLAKAGYRKLDEWGTDYLWSSTVNPNDPSMYYREIPNNGKISYTGDDSKITSSANFARAVKMIRQ